MTEAIRRDVDIIQFLRSVVEENTVAYKEDFTQDIEILFAAADAPKPEDRTYLWMSRPHGTWCEREREVFLQGTSEHSVWTYYDTDNEKFRAYRIVINTEHDGVLYGDIYPIDYPAQIERVKHAALPVHHVTGEYRDGEAFAMSYADMNTVRGQGVIRLHRGIKSIRYHPEDEAELRARIMQEHSIRPRRGKRPPKKQRASAR